LLHGGVQNDEERWLLAHAYRLKGTRGLLIKPLVQTGARVSEFVNIKVEEFFVEEQMMLIARAQGRKSRYVPILPALAQELRRPLGDRTTGYLLETIRHTPFSVRRIQQLIKETADEAKITTRVYPHLLRHSVATTRLERGMPLEQIQKFLGYSQLETTQMYAESTPEMIQEVYPGYSHRGPWQHRVCIASMPIRHTFWARRRRIPSHATVSARIPVGGEQPGGTQAAL
jgi:integrase/recombinase XerD